MRPRAISARTSRSRGQVVEVGVLFFALILSVLALVVLTAGVLVKSRTRSRRASA